MTQVITHRGLDPSIPDFPPESTLEAFRDHLKRGYGIEFDPQLTGDEKWIVLHENNLGRVTKGEREDLIKDLSADDVLAIDVDGAGLTTLDVLLEEIARHESTMSALHLKYTAQESRQQLDSLIEALRDAPFDQFIVFDATIENAKYLKQALPKLKLAASVAHKYDIERYNAAVGGTLLSVEDILAHPGLFDWVWLDEWDLTDKDGGEKRLHTKEVYDAFRAAGIKIALVTPELHGTSPGLLGGEAHPDATDMEKLQERLKEIVALRPDAMCTDYPDLVRDLVAKRDS